MPAILQASCTMQCPHGGTVQKITTNTTPWSVSTPFSAQGSIRKLYSGFVRAYSHTTDAMMIVGPSAIAILLQCFFKELPPGLPVLYRIRVRGARRKPLLLLHNRVLGRVTLVLFVPRRSWTTQEVSQ